MISKTLMIFLTSWILENTEFKKKLEFPNIRVLTSEKMADKACYSSKVCRVKAYYVKEEGMYLIDELNPEEKVCDRSIVLHELVHHYQKNLSGDFDLDEQTMWTLQERQALFYQNLFLYQQKTKNNNKGPENVLECEGGTYLDLQYEYNSKSN